MSVTTLQCRYASMQRPHGVSRRKVTCKIPYGGFAQYGSKAGPFRQSLSSISAVKCQWRTN